MIDFLDPLTMWQEKYPDGFSGKREANLPMLGNKLMIGADVKAQEVERSPSTIEASFHDGQLDVSVTRTECKSYNGVIVASFKIETPDFDTLHLSVAESTVVEIASRGIFDGLPYGDKETPFGTINEMVAFALGHTSLECF